MAVWRWRRDSAVEDEMLRVASGPRTVTPTHFDSRTHACSLLIRATRGGQRG